MKPPTANDYTEAWRLCPAVMEEFGNERDKLKRLAEWYALLMRAVFYRVVIAKDERWLVAATDHTDVVVRYDQIPHAHHVLPIETPELRSALEAAMAEREV